MTITLDLTSDIEKDLLAQATARGLSIAEYVQQIVTREAGQSASASIAPVAEPKNIFELFANSPFKGLNIEFERDRDYGREIDM